MMNKRIKEIREALDLRQGEMGKAIGLTRSGISNIESGQRAVSERHIKLLRSAYNINEHWLRTGEGEMFNPVKPSLDALAEAHQISDLARAIIGGLGDMQPAHRDALVGLILDVGERIRNADYDAAQPENVAASLQYNEFLSAARAESPSDEDSPDIAEPRTE